MSDWRARAACAKRGQPDDETWFPDLVVKRGRTRGAAIARARAICDQCPVQVDCLLFALAMPSVLDRTGIYGGLTPDERADLREQAQASGEAASIERRTLIGGDPDGERAAKLWQGEHRPHRRGRPPEEYVGRKYPAER